MPNVAADRRSFLFLTATTAAGLAIPAELAWAQAQKSTAEPHASRKKKGEEAGEEVAPAEDLMREHGLLNRVLLIYEEVSRRLNAEQDVSPDTLSSAAGIIHNFIEGYHEKLEEDYLFPRFEKANTLVDLVGTLRKQHAAGRQVTEHILALVKQNSLRTVAGRQQVVTEMAGFIRMYRPHEAREDTVLFPALHKIVSKNEYDALGEKFEDIEHQKFGKEGFEGMVEKVAEIEKDLGIYDLAQFTPSPTILRA